MKTLKPLSGLFLLILAVSIAGCRKEKSSPPKALFVPLGIEVSGIPPETPVSLYRASGDLVLRYPPLATRDLLLIFPWRPGEVYRLKAGPTSLVLRAPASRPLATLEVFAPLGSPGKKITVEKKRTALKLTLLSRREAPEIGLLVTSFVPGLNLSLSSGNFTQKYFFQGEFARRLLRPRIYLPPEEPRRLRLLFQAPGRTAEVDLVLRRRVFDLRGKVQLVSWRLPTEESGLSLRYRREGLLVVPNPLFERLGYLLGLRARGYSRYEPLAYETLEFRNLTDVPLNLVVRGEFLDPKNRKPVKGFYPPRFGMSGHARKPLALVYLPPRGRARAVLPIYARKVPPGEYLALIRVYPLGEKTPILLKTRRIGLTRGSPKLAAGLLLILLAGGTYSLIVFLGLRRLLSGFRLRELSLVALSGAVGFGLDFLGGVLSNILYALLGPFNILVGGLITEVVHYAVFTAVFVLVPRPGFATLSGLLHYLMGTVLFGGLRATDPFFVGFRLLTLETALWIFRVYAHPEGRRTILALGLADALSTLSSLVLHMTFYRLFFPEWYLWLSLLVKGFLYTLVGAALGVRLGLHLREMER